MALDAEKHYITAEIKKTLEEELKYLGSQKRKDVIKELEYARSLGDLSENAEYQQAKQELGMLEERILKIEHILRNTVIIEGGHSDTVTVGSEVTVQKTGDKDKKKFKIVSLPEEVDAAKYVVSDKSPVGKALIGKKKGDSISIPTSKGDAMYKVLEVK